MPSPLTTVTLGQLAAIDRALAVHAIALNELDGYLVDADVLADDVLMARALVRSLRAASTVTDSVTLKLERDLPRGSA